MFYLILLIFILIGEFYIKNYIEKKYSLNRKETCLKGKIILHQYHNYGAFLNLMEKKKHFLHLISVIFTFIIALFFIFTLFHRGNKILKLGLTLLLGGAFSNTYDRLYRGYVVDYFSFVTPFPKFNRIVFNLSDFCIMIGSLLLILSEKG